jgi:hypothetical protein
LRKRPWLRPRGLGFNEEKTRVVRATQGFDLRLTVRVAELERRLDRNSKKSNFPASQDLFAMPQGRDSGEGKTVGQRDAAGSAAADIIPLRARDHSDPSHRQLATRARIES